MSNETIKVTRRDGLYHEEGWPGFLVLWVPCRCGEVMYPPENMEDRKLYQMACLNGHKWEIYRDHRSLSSQPTDPSSSELTRLFPNPPKT